MKLFIKGSLIPTVLFFLLIGTAGANLIKNGSFEYGNYTGNGWTRLYAGDTSLNDWSIGGDGVDWHNHSQFGYPPDGDKLIDFNLDGGTIGTISQEFATTPDITYTLTFYLAGPGKEFGFPDPRKIKVNVAGVDYIISQPASLFTDIEWGVKQLNFKAISNITTLTFSSVNSYGFWGPVIDKVSVKQPIDIDIKPGSYPNCFNLNGHGVIPVAILGSADLDVNNVNTDIDADNPLSFNGLEVRVRGKKGPLCSIEYSNEDDYPDLVCHFEDDPSQWSEGTDNAILTGELIDGTPIEGTDSVCIVP